MLYSKKNLYYTYNWESIELESEDFHLDNTIMSKTNGYEVLAVANIFSQMFMPKNTFEDLLKIERLIKILPEFVVTRKDVAYYLTILWNNNKVCL